MGLPRLLAKAQELLSVQPSHATYIPHTSLLSTSDMEGGEGRQSTESRVYGMRPIVRAQWEVIVTSGSNTEWLREENR